MDLPGFPLTPGGPIGPGGPLVPGGPWFPLGPLIPCGPGGPCFPGGPLRPGLPRFPLVLLGQCTLQVMSLKASRTSLWMTSRSMLSLTFLFFFESLHPTLVTYVKL